MHWDRKLTILAAAVLAIMLAAAGWLWRGTLGSIGDGGERIRGQADEGFRLLGMRLEDPEQIARIRISRRGKFDSAAKYRDFDPSWLRETELAPGEEFTEDGIEYTHTVELTLKTYDREGKYAVRDNPVSYTRYDSAATFFKNGDLYYVYYREEGADYHFAVRCAPLTEWLDGITGAGQDR